MSSAWIVLRKELKEVLRDRRTLMAIGLAALATPLVLFVISEVSTQTATQAYTVGYSGNIPVGLDILLRAASLKLETVADPASAARHQVDLGVAFLPGEIDEYYDPTRQSAQIADVRLQTILGQYDAAQAAAALKSRGIDPGILTPLKLVGHPLSSPVEAASNAFLSFFLPYILITMILTGGFSAALDSSAGERERRTLECLLLTPAPRSQLLLGKIGAITVVSLAAAVVAIGSMFVALSQISMPGSGEATSHITLNPAAVPVMVLLALLIAFSFSAVTLALGTLAKSFRQGQAYVTPLYFITILPASIILFIPDFNPNLAYYLIPILNAVLVLRDAIVHKLGQLAKPLGDIHQPAGHRGSFLAGRPAFVHPGSAADQVVLDVWALIVRLRREAFHAMRTEVREADMRSLDRRRMYEIFAPLDANERLPRELLLEGRRFRSLGRREAAGVLWLPLLLASLTTAGWLGLGAPAGVGSAAVVLVGLSVFAKSGKR